MDTELQAELDACLGAAEKVLDGLPEPLSDGAKVDPAVRARIQWIQRQLSNMTAKLKAMQEDMEAGVSLNEMGFADPQEMLDLLNDMSIQIAQLKAMSLALGRSLGHGL
ncbi:hypothetical protein [Cupriavidus nantongensis]|uniref:Chemotaxis protein n=1 Tax=Cupriavidus nantongensis TaxID=1796606 RepID=A0A142JIV5_9BURK|nr:hypothetical protein [Cupriavidus nantongensis]AMR78017.1 hypothetical protein A2G96_09830 [Cupriavidus nantongensis]